MTRRLATVRKPSAFECSTCGKTFQSHQRRAWTCPECKKANKRRSAERFKEQNPDYWSKWNKENGKLYASSVKRLYGLTIEEIDVRRATQGFACAICHRPEGDWNGNGGRLVVDHCHTSQKFRGLLCPYCNRALGQFFDDPLLLSAAIKYLEAQ